MSETPEVFTLDFPDFKKLYLDDVRSLVELKKLVKEKSAVKVKYESKGLNFTIKQTDEANEPDYQYSVDFASTDGFINFGSGYDKFHSIVRFILEIIQ